MPRHLITSSLHFLRFVVITPLLFGGCHDIYTQFCSEKKEKISCLKESDDYSKTVINSQFKSLYRADCPYELQLTHYSVVTCNNPTLKSIGSDFDGYVRINVFKGAQCYWRSQKDFKAQPYQEIEAELLDVMRSDLIGSVH